MTLDTILVSCIKPECKAIKLSFQQVTSKLKVETTDKIWICI